MRNHGAKEVTQKPALRNRLGACEPLRVPPSGQLIGTTATCFNPIYEADPTGPVFGGSASGSEHRNQSTSLEGLLFAGSASYVRVLGRANNGPSAPYTTTYAHFGGLRDENSYFSVSLFFVMNRPRLDEGWPVVEKTRSY